MSSEREICQEDAEERIIMGFDIQQTISNRDSKKYIFN